MGNLSAEYKKQNQIDERKMYDVFRYKNNTQIHKKKGVKLFLKSVPT